MQLSPMQLSLKCLIFNTPTKSEQKTHWIISTVWLWSLFWVSETESKATMPFSPSPTKNTSDKIIHSPKQTILIQIDACLDVGIELCWTIETHIDTSTNIFSGFDGVCMWAFIIQIQHNGHALVDRAIRSYTVLRFKIPSLRKGGVISRKHLNSSMNILLRELHLALLLAVAGWAWSLPHLVKVLGQACCGFLTCTHRYTWTVLKHFMDWLSLSFIHLYPVWCGNLYMVIMFISTSYFSLQKGPFSASQLT